MHKKRYVIIFICVCLGILLLPKLKQVERKPNYRPRYMVETGRVHGTMYKLSYESPIGTSVTSSLDSLFHAFDLSLSTFNDSSIISRINRNDTTVVVDDFFSSVFSTAVEVSKNTGGAFDMTVAPLVNAWGFGFKKKENVTPQLVDSLLHHVGYEKVKLENGRLIKSDPGIMLDASAIAKGYSCDVVARFLESKGVKNYMVDIGGEVVVKGQNPRGQKWSIGIEKPIDDSTMIHQELKCTIYMNGWAVATSGNYRQFYHQGGKKYSHTINPHTGYPVSHNLLSATVIAPDCKTADAYATAFMVLGLEESLILVNCLPNLEAYFIYENEMGEMSVQYTEGFEKYFHSGAEKDTVQ
ncbi:MAG: FAD:protein FMN transferase [Paludibacteraceae bacterium]|nr:FAD:protein FMN transferase [Paludibacteraceae bacterium]